MVKLQKPAISIKQVAGFGEIVTKVGIHDSSRQNKTPYLGTEKWGLCSPPWQTFS